MMKHFIMKSDLIDRGGQKPIRCKMNYIRKSHFQDSERQ